MQLNWFDKCNNSVQSVMYDSTTVTGLSFAGLTVRDESDNKSASIASIETAPTVDSAVGKFLCVFNNFLLSVRVQQVALHVTFVKSNIFKRFFNYISTLKFLAK